MLEQTMIKLYAEILRYQMMFVRQYFRSRALRFLRDFPVMDDWKSMLGTIDGLEGQTRKYLKKVSEETLEGIYRKYDEIWDVVSKALGNTEDIKHNQILNELSCIYGAAFNSSDRRIQCLKGTQVPILRLIENWCCKPSEPPVFWLQGMAGTGKSTIACTVATALQDRRLWTEDEYLPGLICLGGSFFFDKNISDQKTTDKVLPTLARNLANALPDCAGASRVRYVYCPAS
ncbi:uncharacterized protein ASPGLDRAFT_54701 [Aspergillus glaucus CBS 516.65]|uniref:Uncharacterized protein n=1 Tax=Aspergillus glaucus CBS 516.65 TaxID=1160497 RepID=A0A1L9VXS7_ASPGL|nr:hypothetical protein ASPGLDRAFT_54701 [Aspergillus glaucus CBS 516.65]OJJ88702.1 hypothetical protein ASPGLDRAFT_54701 [Aspergillus glaucus CBS 516.65]